MNNGHIKSVGAFISETKNALQKWRKISPNLTVAWFRGMRKECYKLRPKLFSIIDEIKDESRNKTFENDIVQEFRMRAPALYDKTPPYERIDEWLFLMRHVELPTRLLDWTEGALFALFFAIYEIPTNPASGQSDSPVVWMLNPIIFNFVTSDRMFLPLSWNDRSNLYNRKTGKLTLEHAANEKKPKNLQKFASPSNIHAAFQLSGFEYEEKKPIALKPQHIHPRVTAQRSCFTVHGSKREGIEDLFKDKKVNDLLEICKKVCSYKVNQEEFPDCKHVVESIIKNYGEKELNELFLKKIDICGDIRSVKEMLTELKCLGISYSTLFPELTGLSKELELSAKL